MYLVKYVVEIQRAWGKVVNDAWHKPPTKNQGVYFMKKQISKHELRAIIMSTINEALLNGHDFHINIDDIHDRAWDSLKDIDNISVKTNN